MTDIRPIDADALCEGRVSNDPVVIAAKCAPTIDYAPVVNGEWRWKGRYKACSECGTYIDSETLGAGFWRYCPYCAAKMEGGIHDD